MVVRLGYRDRIVQIEKGRVYVFKGKLASAPVEEVVNYYNGQETVLPPLVKDVARAVVEAITGVNAVNLETAGRMDVAQSAG